MYDANSTLTPLRPLGTGGRIMPVSRGYGGGGGGGDYGGGGGSGNPLRDSQALFQQQLQRDQAQFAQQQQLQQQQLAAQQLRDSQQLGLEQQRLAQQGAISRQQIEASLAPTRFAQQKWNQLFPWVQGQLGTMTQNGQGGTWGNYGVPTGDQRPFISDAPVYTQDMIQQHVNAQRAQNDAQTAGQQRDVRNQMAARGYGANSPLAAALSNSLAMGNLATNTANEQDLRWKAAQGNASQVLEAQKARSAADLGYTGEMTKRGVAERQQATSLIAALLGSLS